MAAGNSGNLYSLSRGLSMSKWQTFAQNGLNHPSGAESIGITATSKKYYEIGQSFEDNATPQFANSKPRFESGDTFVNLVLNMTRKGTIYYVLAPEGVVVTKDKGGNVLEWDDLPEDGSDSLASSQLPLQLPDPLNIQDAGKVYSGINGVVYDAVNYYGENVDITETVNGLLPQTKYCAYFVLKGSSPDISRVYAYRFETTAVSKPRIVLSDNTDGSVNIQTLNVPTKLNYILFTEADAALISNLTSAKLIGNLSAEAKASGKTLPAGYADYDILDAMSTTYFYKNAQTGAGNNVYYPSTDETYDGFSVFDVYAGEEIKNIIAEMIRNGTNCGGADIINIGSIEQTPTTPAGVDQELNNMKTETWYVLLTVGYHKDSEKGAGDAFKAATGLRKLDTDPPEFQDSETTVDSSNTSNPNFPTFSGTVSIRFDKSVYRFDEHETDKDLRVLPVYLVTKGTTLNKAVNLLDYLAISAGGTGKVKEHQTMQRPSSSFVLRFEDIPIGGPISLLNGVLISNSNGQSTLKSLTLTLKRDYQKNESGLQILVPYFEAKWGDQIIK